MVTPSCPTGSHCTHCSLQKLTLPKGPSELASPKPNSKLTPNALTTNRLHTTKSAPTNSATMICRPLQQTALRWVPKAKPRQRRAPHRRKWSKIFTHLQAAGFPKSSFGRKAIIRGFWHLASNIISCQIPNEQSKQQLCERRNRESFTPMDAYKSSYGTRPLCWQLKDWDP